MTNEERIELCLKRLSMCKTSDVMNFSYADTLAYIERLKEENADLRASLENEHYETQKRKMALEYACLDMVKGDEQFLENWQEEIAYYMKLAEDVIGDKNTLRITFEIDSGG